MSDNNLYLQYVDEIVEELNQEKAKSEVKTIDDIFKYFEYLKAEYVERLESTIDEIFDDYCDENNLKWSDEDE